VNILHRAELAAAEDPATVREQKVTEYEDALANPYIAAERGYVDAVIAPSATRAQIVRGLRALRTKRDTLPPKKHGNIPL
jgi:propionyl-CoA carboxylase beta chain